MRAVRWKIEMEAGRADETARPALFKDPPRVFRKCRRRWRSAGAVQDAGAHGAERGWGQLRSEGRCPQIDAVGLSLYAESAI